MPLRHQAPGPSWVDCQDHGAGSGAELLLVEGESALQSVLAVRDPRCQAVLAMQGKPLNACKASAQRVAAHLPFVVLAQALGLPGPTAVDGRSATSPPALRFERLLMLFDPDADGIHIAALMVLYVQRWMPCLIAQQRLWWVSAPMFRPAAAGQPANLQVPYRGLGNIAPAALRLHCVDPVTRRCRLVQKSDVVQVMASLGVKPAPD